MSCYNIGLAVQVPKSSTRTVYDMKHLVVQSSMRSADIRPPELIARLQELAAGAAREFLATPGELVEVPCPGCGGEESRPAFERLGFGYVECAECGSLWVRLRPSAEALARHYAQSAAAEARLSYFASETASARFEYIVQSRVEWISEQVERVRSNRELRFADVGTLYPAMFTELSALTKLARLASLETDSRIAEQLPPSVRLDSADAPFDVVTAFEQIEHQFSPLDFLRRLREQMAPGASLLLTMRSASGFDIQTLWGGSTFLLIPEHLNLLSLKGVEALLTRVGLEPLELSTPGEMDTDIVRQAALSDSALDVGRFVRTLLLERGDAALDEFQAFLQRNRLSSHVRVTARAGTL